MIEKVEAELNELAVLIGRLQRGELTLTEFRSNSVHYGVYTQRQADRYFVRLRVPYGMILPTQLSTLATAIETWGVGECHLTTRQGVEVHDLALDSIVPLLRVLAEVDLFSHETGGSSIRSVMVCPHAGVGLDEPFDVTPYADLLTRHFVRHPAFQSLPRKMKIAFSCCEADCVHSFAQDLGFQGRTDAQGEHGFRVLVGGGTGVLPRLGKELTGFLPARHVPLFTEAVLRVFNQLGDRQERRRARLKFLVRSLGLVPFHQAVLHEWSVMEREGSSYPTLRPLAASPIPTELGDGPTAAPSDNKCGRDDAFEAWTATQVQFQQDGAFRTVRVSLAGGFLNAAQLRCLATLAERFAMTIRTTPEQGLLLRGTRLNQLAHIHQTLAQTDLLKRPAVSRLVACPGSSACSNAFTNTRGLAQAITARLAAQPVSASALGQLRVRLSGCPNGCALHALADIGLEGVTQREGSDW